MSEEEALEAMERTIAVYAQRIHQRFQWGRMSWTIEDLQQEGRLAVALACRTFDPTRAAFPTYVRPRLWGVMWDFVRRHTRATARGVSLTHVSLQTLPPDLEALHDPRAAGYAQVEARQTLRALVRVPHCASSLTLVLRHIGHEEELALLGREVGITTNAMRNRIQRCLRRLQAACAAPAP